MKRVTRTLLGWVSLAVIVPLASSCHDETVVGTYTATTFTCGPTGAASTNVLAAGGSISLTIADDMSTGGTLTIPAGVNCGSTGTTSLLGHAGKVGTVVTLNTTADSFMREMQFSYGGTTLSGSGTFSGIVVIVILSK